MRKIVWGFLCVGATALAALAGNQLNHPTPPATRIDYTITWGALQGTVFTGVEDGAEPEDPDKPFVSMLGKRYYWDAGTGKYKGRFENPDPVPDNIWTLEFVQDSDPEKPNSGTVTSDGVDENGTPLTGGGTGNYTLGS